MDARPTQAPAVNEPTDRTDHNEVIAAINAIAHSPICALVIVYALETHETITQFFLSSSGIRVSLICFGVGVALESGHIWAGRRTKSNAKYKDKNQPLQWRDRVAAVFHRYSSLIQEVVHLLALVSLLGLSVVARQAVGTYHASSAAKDQDMLQLSALDACRSVYRACLDVCGSDNVCHVGCRDEYFACRNSVPGSLVKI